jgi:hypothetical protein
MVLEGRGSESRLLHVGEGVPPYPIELEFELVIVLDCHRPWQEIGNTGEDAYDTLGPELRLSVKYHRRPACVL